MAALAMLALLLAVPGWAEQSAAVPCMLHRLRCLVRVAPRRLRGNWRRVVDVLELARLVCEVLVELVQQKIVQKRLSRQRRRCR